MTEAYHPLSQKFNRRELLQLMFGSGLGLMATGLAGIACSSTPDSSRPVNVPPPKRLPPIPVPTKKVTVASPTVRAIAPATFGPTISTQSSEWKEILRPITKQDILEAIDTAPPLYRRFGSFVRKLYSDPYPKSIAIGEVTLQVYEPAVEFKLDQDPDAVRGEAFFQLVGKAPLVRFNRIVELQAWLPYMDDSNPDKETPVLVRFFAGIELMTGLQPKILLEVPNIQLFSLTEQQINSILERRKMVLRKESFTIAGGLDYMSSMVRIMREHNSSFNVLNTDGTEVELLTQVFRVTTREANRALALHDLGPAILAIKSYQDHPTMWPTLMTSDPKLESYFDLIKNTDFGSSPDQLVKSVYRFLIDNRALFKNIPLGYKEDLDKHP